MEPELVQTTLGGGVPDFSVFGMFAAATLVVQIVMLMLLGASIWCWAIIVDKWIRYGRVKRAAEKFEETFWSGKPLDELYEKIADKPSHPMEVLFVKAMREWNRASGRGGLRPNLPERIHKVMQITLIREMTVLERNLSFLATVGSTAPFVGLFGTVWGIMSAFQAIAISKNTTLAVVAPGIAEALFATALGLIAAIPAVMAYNKFSSDMNRYATRLEGFSDEFAGILTRQVEEQD